MYRMADDRSGVIDSSKTYDETALLDILGCASGGKENRRKWLKRQFIDRSLPFMPLGNKKLISGHKFNLWIQENSRTWEEWQDEGDDQV